MIKIVKTDSYDPSKIFQPSNLAQHYCVGKGIEFGAAAHNPFNLPDCINIDSRSGFELFKDYQIRYNGCYAEVDVFADAGEYISPAPLDYIITSHVVEHFPNPIAVFQRWTENLKIGGIVFMIVPKRDAVPGDAARPVSTVTEIYQAWKNSAAGNPGDHHFVYTLDLMLELIIRCRDQIGWEVIDARATDDKVGNGFVVVCRKTGEANDC
jgi:SAM-dependent methyltransferase